MFVGIDLGASAVHVVVVDASLEVVGELGRDRCSERAEHRAASGRHEPIAEVQVPWVTPRTDAACAARMRVGFRLFELLGALAGCRLAKKTSVEGRRARVEVLRRAGIRARALELPDA